MSAVAWDQLHRQERHQLRYPSEHVVRFLAAIQKGGATSVLDVGCGAGRHMRLAEELGLEPSGVDISENALDRAAEYGDTHIAATTDLPFPDNTFDAAICTGVLYYAALTDMEKATSEILRVVKPAGWTFITTKTTKDWRRGSGEQTAEDTFVLRIPGEPEDGMTLTFLSPQEVGRVFGVFRDLHVELAEHTTMNRLRLNSDWLVTAWK